MTSNLFKNGILNVVLAVALVLFYPVANAAQPLTVLRVGTPSAVSELLAYTMSFNAPRDPGVQAGVERGTTDRLYCCMKHRYNENTGINMSMKRTHIFISEPVIAALKSQ